MSDLVVTTACAADGGSVDITTVDGTTSHAGLADGSYQFSVEAAGAAYAVDVQVACESPEQAVTWSAFGVGGAVVPADTSGITDTTELGGSLDTLVVEDPTLFSVEPRIMAAPMASSLPSTGGDTGLVGAAIVMVLVGAVLVRLVRRTA